MPAQNTTCEDCGLPIPICNAIALSIMRIADMEGKDRRAAFLEWRPILEDEMMTELGLSDPQAKGRMT